MVDLVPVDHQPEFDEADQSAMMPETFVPPMLVDWAKQAAPKDLAIIKGAGKAAEDLATLPKRAIENSQFSVGTGTYDPRVPIEAALTAMSGGVGGTGEKAAGEVLGSGPARMRMIDNVDLYKELANQNRAKGFATGKSAAGWDTKRPDAAKGSWEDLVARTKAAWEGDKARAINEYEKAAPGAQARSPLMTDEDYSVAGDPSFSRATFGSGATDKKSAALVQAIKGGLDMSQEGRMARAVDQGYDTSTPLYHGTSKDADFQKFKDSRHGTWTTTDPAEASAYAKDNDSKNLVFDNGKYVRTNEADRVLPLYGKPLQNPYTGPVPDSIRTASNYKKAQSDWFDQLKRQGYDGVDMGGGVRVDFNNANLRSQFAPFDPKNQGKSMLLGSGSTDEKNAALIQAVRGGLDMNQEARMARAAEQGYQGPWYHGGLRMDRFTGTGKIDPKRATSGPMPYFTDDPEMASSYAMGKKPDTSLEDTGQTANYFTVSPKDLGISGRSPLTVEQSWHFLPPDVKQTILNNMKRVGFQDKEMGEGPFVLHPEGTNGSIAGDQHWDHVLNRESRGNPLTALRDVWHDSGTLINDPGQLSEIYRLAGYPHPISEASAPWTEARGVFPGMLKMTNPLDTTDANMLREKVLPALEQEFKSDRSRKAPYGVDMWDKNSRYTPKEWVQQAKEDLEKGENSYVWTSIPDKVTAALRKQGYDGILDTGGKAGGTGHTVAIPFGPEQVRSTFAKFDPKNEGKSMLLGSGATDKQNAALLQAIRAYHGSPHDFDRFDMSKIGTGEGAQAYGHGLYFAENEGTAKSYRDALSGKADNSKVLTIDGQRIDTPTPAMNFLNKHQWDVDSAVSAMQPRLNAAKNKLETASKEEVLPGISDRDLASIDHKYMNDFVNELQSYRGKNAQWVDPGHMYEVNINADPEHFLDWDKPLSQQKRAAEALQKAGLTESAPKFEWAGDPNVMLQLQKNGSTTGTNLVKEGDRYREVVNGRTTGEIPASALEQWKQMHLDSAQSAYRAPDPTGMELIRNKPGAEKALADAGIPGIKYLDQGSRTFSDVVEHAGMESPRFSVKGPNGNKWFDTREEAQKHADAGSTRNYVVFNDKLIDILRKYGIAGLPAGGVAAGAMQGQPAPADVVNAIRGQGGG